MSETFQFQPTVPSGRVASAALGADANSKLNDKDVGKPVKIGSSDTYVLCADGDELEGFLYGVEPNTVNNGFSFGSVLTCNLGDRVVAINKGGSSIAVGAYVLAAAQAARNTANTAGATSASGLEPCPYIKAGVANNTTGPVFQSPGTFRWRVVSLLGGSGAVDSEVLIERVG